MSSPTSGYTDEMPTSSTDQERFADRPATSRVVHRVNEVTTRPVMAIVVTITVVIALTVIVAPDFDADLQLAFGTVCFGITVPMLFVLQHTQRREQMALQLKLDEIVHALPQADNRLVGVEGSTDDELLELEQRRLDHIATRDESDA